MRRSDARSRIRVAGQPREGRDFTHGDELAHQRWLYCARFYWIDENGWVSEYRCNVSAYDIGGSSDTGGSTLWLGDGFDPALSPDGTRMAFVVGAMSPGSFEPSHIIVADLRDRTYTNLTANDPAPASTAAWSWTVAWHSKAAGAGLWSCICD